MTLLTARLAIPDHLKPKAAYALRELCHRAGFGLRIVESEYANILYSSQPGPAHKRAALRLQFHQCLFRPETVCRVHVREAAYLWEEASLSTTEQPDVVGGAYRLLTLLDETQIPNAFRDQKGTFLTRALPTGRRASFQEPLIEFHVAALLRMLSLCCPEAPQRASPRWPNGKTYALVMTHDCDHIDVGSPMEIATNLTKAILRRNSTYAAMGWSGLHNILSPRHNPYFSFPWWRGWENQRGLHSTFYMFVRPIGVPPALNDCKTTSRNPATDWRLIRRMMDEGWEIGLHAPLNMRKYPASFRDARCWLEEHTGHTVTGIRHHYFALDWTRPYESHRAHANAGFTYDSSIAFRDAPGFRSGTSLPYRSFDPESNQELPLLVLPCSLMDGHIIPEQRDSTRDREAEIAAGVQIVDAVRKTSGLLVLNWHQESAFNRAVYDGYIDVLERLYEVCSRDAVWVATAEELCSYWSQRRSELDNATDVLPMYHALSGTMRPFVA